MRGFQVDGTTDEAVSLMKQTKVYPLSAAASPPTMEFINGTEHPINVVFPDSFRYFELLADQVNDEPLDVFGPLERAQMQSIGIRKGQSFAPDEHMKQLFVRSGPPRRRHRPCPDLRTATRRRLLLLGQAAKAAWSLRSWRKTNCHSRMWPS